MTKSKSYNGLEGTNFIEGSELANTTIYAVKRSGIQYDKYISGSSSRKYIYSSSMGRVVFPEVFNTGGETVFVIYKESSPLIDPIPGICIPVVIISGFMPDAVVGVPYYKAFVLNGSTPFFLNVIQKPSWATVSLVPLGIVTVFGFPDVDGPEVLEFSVTNCGGSDSVLESFNTLPNTNNLSVTSTSVSRINSVTGLPYVITSGSFPVSLVTPLSGIHDAYTGTITVNVTISFGPAIFPKDLVLRKNAIHVETINIPSNGTYVFASQSYLSTDVIQIVLN